MSTSLEKSPVKGNPAEVPETPRDFYTLPPTAIMRIPKVAEVLGVSVPTVWRWARENQYFPKGRRIGPRTTAWLVGEVRDFIANPTAKGGAAK
jgi:predicted DNA-binding transcriptional regulator AlpA